MMENKNQNPHRGTDFEEALKQDGDYERILQLAKEKYDRLHKENQSWFRRLIRYIKMKLGVNE